MHAIVIVAKKNCLTHWLVVICRVNVDGVRGYLAKSTAVIKRVKERLEVKSEGGDSAAQSQVWLPQQDRQSQFYPRHELSR